MQPLRYHRRDFLRFGMIGLGGLAIPDLIAAAPSGQIKAKACILLYMDGGPSHIDLWDLKPNAPEEVRGPFTVIATSVPGIRVCEHLPRVARQMHRLCQVRSVRHTETIHDPAVYQMLTGRKHPISAGGLAADPGDFPQIGTAFGKVDTRSAVMPKVVELPETMKMDARILPGQNAGCLGASHDPFRVEVARDGRVQPPEFRRRDDISVERLSERGSLLQALDRQHRALHGRSAADYFDRFHQQALAVLAHPHIREAFNLEAEPLRCRELYGSHRHGRSVLLARRLVEAGSRFVTVYWGKEEQDWADGQGKRMANNPWDTHRNHFPLLKDDLLPRADQALAALVEDLHQRGMLDETLVLWMGDFGRTPRIDRKYASRDHWPHANTILFAGAGVPGGTVYGRTDHLGAYVVDNPLSPADITATVFHRLGVDSAAVIQDGRGQGHPLSEGKALRF